jgi:hypothetical protein
MYKVGRVISTLHDQWPEYVPVPYPIQLRQCVMAMAAGDHRDHAIRWCEPRCPIQRVLSMERVPTKAPYGFGVGRLNPRYTNARSRVPAPPARIIGQS